MDNFIVAGKYRIISKIGSGFFADIFRGINITNGEEVALKLEHTLVLEPQLPLENKLYKQLADNIGFPKIHYFGQRSGYQVLVMELLGPSLEDLFNNCKRHFTIKTVLMLADQMIVRLECLHNQNILHRDIKPKSFLMGIGDHRNTLFLINFGRAKRYRGIISNNHIRYRENWYAFGTLGYCSINAQRGIEQSRRDDMESLGYVMVYFKRGRLPWQGLKAISRLQQLEKMAEIKMSTPVEVLCQGCPIEFAMYLSYCRGLRFMERPDYTYLRHLFRFLSLTLNLRYDYDFDWKWLKRLKERRLELSIDTDE